MTYFSYFSFLVIAVVFSALSLFFVLLITKNMQQGRLVRRKLAQRIESLRISKMLRALGLDPSQYLHTVPLHKINQSMNKCEHCQTTDQCDEKLKQGSIKADEIDFCPNHEDLANSAR